MIKKLMWAVSFIIIATSAVVMQFLPDSVPMHYDFEGNIDRWGSKWEVMIMPALILIMALIWSAFIRFFNKKAENAKDDKAKKEAETNCKVMSYVGLISVVFFGITHFATLHGDYVAARDGLDKMAYDNIKLVTMLLGILFIILGNIMPKTRKNGMLGIRTVWSCFNDATWAKSNHFGGIIFIIAGILTIVTALLADGNFAMILMLCYLLAATVIICIYSKKVYDSEKKKLS